MLRSWLRVSKPVNSPKSSPLHTFERLEERDCPADLTGYGVGLSGPAAETGQSVTVSWSVANYDWDTILTDFDVAIVLSRDTTFDADDVQLTRRNLPAGFPGMFAIPTQHDTVALPASGHAVWNGSGTYYIGLRVDDTNRVWEWNEANNSGVGAGIDFVPLTVTLSGGGGPGGGGGGPGGGGGGPGGGGGGVVTPGTVEALPATGYKAGSVLKGILTGLNTDLKQLAKEDQQLRSKVGRLTQLPIRWYELTGLAGDVNAIKQALNPLLSGNATKVNIAGMELDRAGLDVLERTLAFVFDLGAATDDRGGDWEEGSAMASLMAAPARTRTASFAGGVSASEAEMLPPQWLSRTGRAGLKEKTGVFERNMNIIKDAVVDWAKGTKAGKAVVNLLDTLNDLGKSLNRNSQMPTEETFAQREERFRQHLRDLKEQTAEPTFEDLFREFDTQRKGIFNVAHGRIKKLLEKEQVTVQRLEDQVINIYKLARNQSIAGVWKGDFQTPSQFGGIMSVPIDFNFKKVSGNEAVSGVLGYNKGYYNQSNQWVSQGRVTASFSGRLDDDNVFRGELKYNAGGRIITTTISWSLNEGRLSGPLFEGSDYTFNIGMTKKTP